MFFSLMFLQVIMPWSYAFPEKARIELFLPAESFAQDVKRDIFAAPSVALSLGSVREKVLAERLVALPTAETVRTPIQSDLTNYPHDWLDPGFA